MMIRGVDISSQELKKKKLGKSYLFPYHFKLCATYVFDKLEELSNYVYPHTNISISDVGCKANVSSEKNKVNIFTVYY
jgi:hypothetical protein